MNNAFFNSLSPLGIPDEQASYITKCHKGDSNTGSVITGFEDE